MSIAYWCVLIAACCRTSGRFSPKGGATDYNNKGPHWLGDQTEFTDP